MRWGRGGKKDKHHVLMIPDLTPCKKLIGVDTSWRVFIGINSMRVGATEVRYG